MISNLIKYRYLTFTMLKRNLESKYKGSFIGVFWFFFNPLILLAVYTICFSYIFKSKWGGGADTQSVFTLILFTGLIVYTFFSEVFSQSPGLILGHGYVIKKTPFPIDILSWVLVGSALFQVSVSTIILLGINFFVYHDFSWTTVFFPIVLVPFCVLLMAISWFLSAIGVFFRDMTQISGLVLTVLMFLSPVFFPLHYLPEPYHSFAYFNPLTLIIEESRKVLLYKSIPDFKALSLYFVISFVLMKLSYNFLMKMKKDFGDVI